MDTRVLYAERHGAQAKGRSNALWSEEFWNVECPACEQALTPTSTCNLPCSHRRHTQCVTAGECPACHANEQLGTCAICSEQLIVDGLTTLACYHAFHSECIAKPSLPKCCPICNVDIPPNDVTSENQRWRLRERTKTKTTSGALVLCLNIGTEPPDVIKFSPCARNECWINPFAQSRRKSLEAIGLALQNQYLNLQNRAIYQQLLDPTVEELRSICSKLRQRCRGDRLLFHYNGHGVPKPTPNGELWFFNEGYSQYIPLSLSEIRSNIVGTPTIYVLDCSNAGLVMDALTKDESSREGEAASSATAGGHEAVGDIILLPCGANELLPRDEAYPADLFSTCLTTPIPMALRWFVLQNQLAMSEVSPDSVDQVPGKLTERKTPMGELNWVFTAITDSIAWNCLPLPLFHQLFRQDILVASMFRNFFLADRILRSLGCTPATSPALPSNISLHPLWQSWDLAAESTLTAFLGLRIPPVMPPSAETAAAIAPSTCSFFADQLTAFEVWLNMGPFRSGPPEHLPIVLQVLLSQAHRLRALQLLLVFFNRHGTQAVNLALSVGIHPYVLKLLQSPAQDLRQVLISIWAKIIAYDKSCQVELVSPQMAPSPRGAPSAAQSPHLTFLAHLANAEDLDQQTNAAFVVAGICDGYPPGQAKCLEAGLHHMAGKLLRGTDALRFDPIVRMNQIHHHEKQASLSATTGASLPTPPAIDPRSMRGSEDDALLKQWLCLCIAELCRSCATSQTVCTLQTMTQFTLFDCLHDPSPEVRAAATYALACMFSAPEDSPLVNRSLSPDARLQCDLLIATELQTILEGEGSPMVRRELAFAFATFSKSHPSHKYGLHLTLVTKSVEEEASVIDSGTQNEELQWAEEPTRFNSYRHISKALLLLSNDPFPSVAHIGKLVVTMVVEKSSSPSWHQASSRVSVVQKSHGIFSWSRANFGHVEDCSDPLSAQGTKELYWRNRNAKEEVRMAKFAVDCRLKLADYRKEAERLDAEKTVSSENRSISGLLKPSSLFTPTDPVGDMTGERTPSPPKLVAFDKSQILESTAEMTTLAKFHPYEALLATGDDSDGISLFAYEQGERCWQLRNGNVGGSRMTSLDWMNEDGPARLAVASDDGMVRLWGGLGGFNNGPRVVSCLNAVPDISMGWDGSGLVTSYAHPAGRLFAGGQSPNIRLWDLKTERCISTWLADSKSGSCVTALDVARPASAMCAAPPAVLGESVVLAGFGDGALRLFDARLPKDRNAVATWHDHNAWVVGVHLSCEYGAISGSVQGDINFLDLRTSGAVRTLDPLADRSATMTAFAVHPNAPILAVGTHAQFIKVLTMDGYVLNRIKYHDGFLGQRIGPVSCLTFHPHRPVMAAGATDSIISVYSNSDE